MSDESLEDLLWVVQNAHHALTASPTPRPGVAMELLRQAPAMGVDRDEAYQAMRRMAQESNRINLPPTFQEFEGKLPKVTEGLKAQLAPAARQHDEQDQDEMSETDEE